MKMLNFITNCYYLTYNRTVVIILFGLRGFCHRTWNYRRRVTGYERGGGSVEFLILLKG